MVLALLAQPLLAQDSENVSKLRFGARVGAVVSNFSKEQPHTGARFGFMAGGVIECAIADVLSLQAEPAYMQQGGRFVRFYDDTRFGSFDNLYEVYTTNADIKLHTIDIPILAKYTLSKIGDFKPNVVFGPAIGYTFGAANSYQTTFHYQRTFTTTNAFRYETSQYEPFQLGVTAGVGGEVSLGSKRLMIDFRYRYGITPVKKGFSYIDIFTVQGDLRTNSAFVTVGIGL